MTRQPLFTKTMKYEIRGELDENLVLLWTECGEEVWTRGRLRIKATCEITIQPIAENFAWRPTAKVNDANDWRRISDAGMNTLKWKQVEAAPASTSQ